MLHLIGVIPEVGGPEMASYVSKTTELFAWRSHPNLVKAPTEWREPPTGAEYCEGAKEELV